MMTMAGLDDATKAGRDRNKMDTCGGPDLLGKYVNDVLHFNDNKQYCGNGFGVYSNIPCKVNYRELRGTVFIKFLRALLKYKRLFVTPIHNGYFLTLVKSWKLIILNVQYTQYGIHQNNNNLI
jgi:hypothetical protein